MSMADELQKLQQMHDSGTISDEDFVKAKNKLLGESTAGDESSARLWTAGLHLSQLAGFAAPGAGLIVPIVIWQLKKADIPEIDTHGKIVANWIISVILYLAVSMILTFVVIGVPLLLALCAAAIAFPIVGAIKANNGEVWKYPLSIPFFK